VKASATDPVELPAGTVFIGDLHLDVDDLHAVARFELTLAALRPAPRIVFVGDVFEYWIGPAQGAGEGGQRVLAALAAAARDAAVDVVPGNRDFLLEARFERASGAAVRHGGFVGRLPGGERMLVIHGDELCTLDRNYLRLRAVLRSPLLRWAAPRLPESVARAIARKLRRASTRALAAKPKGQAEQQPDAVRDFARSASAGVLLCGHAHRYRDERLPDGPRWIVLDAWGERRDLIRVLPGGALAAGSTASAGGSALGTDPGAGSLLGG